MKKFTLTFISIILTGSLCSAQSGTASRVKGDPGRTQQGVTTEILNHQGLTDLTPLEEQGFESLPDFTLDVSPWITSDEDGGETYGIDGYTFTNNYDPMAFIVFNPASVSPSMAGDPAIQPHSGNKFAACFSTVPPPYNDDWLISPMVSLGTSSKVTFWVKSYTGDYGLERYKVGVSTTNSNPSSFTIISGSNPLLAPADSWQEVEFDLSAYDGQDVYVGIQCLSEDAFIFMVDDITIEWEDAPLTAPTNLDASLNQSNGQVSLTWDFEGSTGEWVPVTGNWTLAPNNFSVTNDEHDWVSVMYDMPMTDFEFEVTCRESQEDQSQVGIMFCGSPEPIYTNGFWYTGYSYTISTNAGWGLYSFGRQDPDNFSYFVDWTQTDYVNYGTGVWNTIKVIRSGGNIELFVNDNSLGTWFDNTFTSGYLGMHMKAPTFNGYAEYKDFTMRVSPDGNRAFKHFKIYRNGSEIATTGNQFFTDNLPGYGTYEYKVSAVYDEGESTMAGPESVSWQGGSGSATLTGLVFDATNDEPIEGATVTVAGKSDVTDQFGNYTITDLPAGLLTANFSASPTSGTKPLTVQFSDLSLENAHTVSCSKSGYSPYENSQVEIPEGSAVTLDIPMSPQIAAGQMRMVLSWGAFPEDLDAHLLTPNIEGSEYEVYYSDPGLMDAPPYALLDNDDVNGYGPETITIFERFSGTYKYFIFNYDENASITVSNASVKIYNDMGLMYDIDVPTSGDGYYWYVCDIDGATGNVTLRNQIMDMPPSRLSNAGKGKKDKQAMPGLRNNIISWQWNFGDGGTSDAQNPDHRYNADGVYTVSLTVNTASTSDIETKTNYILVGESSIDENTGSLASIYPNPANSKVHIIANESIDQIRMATMDGKIIFESLVGSTNYEFDVSSYSEGQYIIWYQCAGKTGMSKLMIRR